MRGLMGYGVGIVLPAHGPARDDAFTPLSRPLIIRRGYDIDATRAKHEQRGSDPMIRQDERRMRYEAIARSTRREIVSALLHQVQKT